MTKNGLIKERLRTDKPRFVLIGKECVGKSELVSALTRVHAESGGIPGTTVACEIYDNGAFTLMDTPGILRDSDTETTRMALNALRNNEKIMLIVKATQIDDDLKYFLPLVKGKRGMLAVTYWDKLDEQEHPTEALSRLQELIGVPVIPLDARNITDRERDRFDDAISEPRTFVTAEPPMKCGWEFTAPRTIFDGTLIGKVLAMTALFLPAIIAVKSANAFANWAEPFVQTAVATPVAIYSLWPSYIREVLVGTYGLLTMGPLLLVWATPTVLVFALMLSLYESSGLIHVLTIAVHPLLRPFGLSGRDLVRVILGFGCNVPAVINTRACSHCSRDNCIVAIAFASACSYQMGASLSVFAAAGKEFLVVPYLGALAASALIYLRIVSSAEARSRTNELVTEGTIFISLPSWRTVLRQTETVVRAFFLKAFPIFLIITLFASILNAAGVIQRLSFALGPFMALLRLPSDAALPVLMASIRKDGILLLAEKNTLLSLSTLQLLTAVYLASVLLPCLVTLWTIARERSAKLAIRIALRQSLAAIAFTIALSWGGNMAIQLFHALREYSAYLPS